jgi:hypothetical protein
MTERKASAKAVGWLENVHPTLRKGPKDGHPVIGGQGSEVEQRQIQGSFASLRMTTTNGGLGIGDRELAGDAWQRWWFGLK